MRISHKTAISSDVCGIQIIEVIAGVRLGRYLRESPYPFLIGYIIKTFVLGSSCHQCIACTSGFSNFCSFFPLSGQQVGTSQKAVDDCYIRLELLVITTANIVFQIILRQVQIVKNTLVNLCHCRFSFRYRLIITRFGINRNTRCILILQIGKLIMLYQMQITESTQCQCLSLYLSEFFRIPLDRNGSITIIYRFIYQIPGKLCSTVRRKCYIIKLIRRIKTIFRTGNNITCHHIIQTLKCPITNIGIGT